MDAASVLIQKADSLLKGDLPGHPFRGNQWTGGETISDPETWKNLPKFIPYDDVLEVQEKLGLNPDWRLAPKNWTSRRAKELGMIAINANAKKGVQLHELGHEYWSVKMTRSMKDAVMSFSNWLKEQPIYGEGIIKNPDKRWRVLSNGEVIDIGHGKSFDRNNEIFSQLFSLNFENKLSGIEKKAFDALMDMSKENK